MLLFIALSIILAVTSHAGAEQCSTITISKDNPTASEAWVSRTKTRWPGDQAVRQLNPGIDFHKLREGDTVTVPSYACEEEISIQKYRSMIARQREQEQKIKDLENVIVTLTQDNEQADMTSRETEKRVVDPKVVLQETELLSPSNNIGQLTTENTELKKAFIGARGSLVEKTTKTEVSVWPFLLFAVFGFTAGRYSKKGHSKKRQSQSRSNSLVGREDVRMFTPNFEPSGSHGEKREDLFAGAANADMFTVIGMNDGKKFIVPILHEGSLLIPNWPEKNWRAQKMNQKNARSVIARLFYPNDKKTNSGREDDKVVSLHGRKTA